MAKNNTSLDLDSDFEQKSAIIDILLKRPFVLPKVRGLLYCQASCKTPEEEFYEVQRKILNKIC